MELIITTPERLETVVLYAVLKALRARPKVQDPPDRCGSIEALEFLNKEGYKISKSLLYKLTATNNIPCKVYGSRLVFSRKELTLWIESQAVAKNSSTEAVLELAKKVRNKKGGLR